MKRLKDFSITICMVVFVSLTAQVVAQPKDSPAPPSATNGITISLLTCSPGDEVWSLYGHTAIRFQDSTREMDLAINYGMFNFRQKNFILRFVLGLTDYEMGIEPFQMFMMEYARNGRGVIEQRLNLTNEEKIAIATAISKNYETSNRTYRYNYFYDNCTTRARDIIINNIDGHVEYPVTAYKTSYREMIHQWNAKHRWARFGNDLLLGFGADKHTNQEQQQFLPDTLRKDFASGVIINPAGRSRRLVDSTFEVLKPNSLNNHTETNIWDNLSPRCVFGIFFALILVSSLFEWKRKRPFWLVDVTLLTLNGLAGLVLLTMVFSQHPTVNLNLQILLLNPLSIIFAYSAINQQIKGSCHWYWKLHMALIVLFLIGNIFQNYAEGMNILALILMIRCILNIRTLNAKK